MFETKLNSLMKQIGQLTRLCRSSRQLKAMGNIFRLLFQSSEEFEKNVIQGNRNYPPIAALKENLLVSSRFLLRRISGFKNLESLLETAAKDIRNALKQIEHIEQMKEDLLYQKEKVGFGARSKATLRGSEDSFENLSLDEQTCLRRMQALNKVLGRFYREKDQFLRKFRVLLGNQFERFFSEFRTFWKEEALGVGLQMETHAEKSGTDTKVHEKTETPEPVGIGNGLAKMEKDSRPESPEIFRSREASQEKVDPILSQKMDLDVSVMEDSDQILENYFSPETTNEIQADRICESRKNESLCESDEESSSRSETSPEPSSRGSIHEHVEKDMSTGTYDPFETKRDNILEEDRETEKKFEKDEALDRSEEQWQNQNNELSSLASESRKSTSTNPKQESQNRFESKSQSRGPDSERDEAMSDYYSYEGQGSRSRSSLEDSESEGSLMTKNDLFDLDNIIQSQMEADPPKRGLDKSEIKEVSQKEDETRDGLVESVETEQTRSTQLNDYEVDFGDDTEPKPPGTDLNLLESQQVDLEDVKRLTRSREPAKDGLDGFFEMKNEANDYAVDTGDTTSKSKIKTRLIPDSPETKPESTPLNTMMSLFKSLTSSMTTRKVQNMVSGPKTESRDLFDEVSKSEFSNRNDPFSNSRFSAKRNQPKFSGDYGQLD